MFSANFMLGSVLTGLLATAYAAPATTESLRHDPRTLGQFPSRGSDSPPSSILKERTIDCDTLVTGLSADDCAYLSTISVAGQGTNAVASNGGLWIGDDGPSTFVFTNNAGVDLILVMWSADGYTGSFVEAEAPAITYSLAATGDSVTISVADGFSGGWAALYNHATVLTSNGQVDNTWGEFTSGADATVDISREVNMDGNTMTLETSGGCAADMTTCAFTCIDDTLTTCADEGTYQLLNCDGNYTTSSGGDAPSGGCQGWTDGTITVSFES